MNKPQETTRRVRPQIPAAANPLGSLPANPAVITQAEIAMLVNVRKTIRQARAIRDCMLAQWRNGAVIESGPFELSFRTCRDQRLTEAKLIPVIGKEKVAA